MQNDTLPGVDAYADELTAAADNKPMKCHRVCGACHPEVREDLKDGMHMGIEAVCGEKLLGIPAQPGANYCDRCRKLWAGHAMNHMYNGGSSRG